MCQTSPLNPQHEQGEASFLMYGAGNVAAPVVETFGEIEAEYAAIRKACVLLDLPQRGTICASGLERLDFLGRMVTNDVAGLMPFESRRTFWLNRKGRIDADLRVIQLDDAALIDVDLLVAEAAATSLEAFVFSEDVHFSNVTEQWHRLALHGPGATDVLATVSEPDQGPPIADLNDLQASRVRIGGHPVVINRQDALAVPGYEMLLEVEHVAGVYDQLLEQGEQPGAEHGRSLRAAGWGAFNIARIEAGWPMFNIDFGTNSLPHESGVLRDRVNFRKGCYLGQEVVARMESLGHPKQMLVALRLEPLSMRREGDDQPETGAPVFAASQDPAAEARPVGAITSSTRSPMLGDQVICFAQVKWNHAQSGAALLVRTAAGDAPAVVQPGLRFWPKPVKS